MKFKIEVDLEWIEDEEGNIDSMVKDEIVSTVLRKIKTDDIEAKIKHRIDEILSNVVIKGLDENVNKTYNEFVKKEISITNDYGDVIKNCTIYDLIKDKFDNFMTETVDSSGRPSTSYSKKGKRIDWLIDQRIAEHSKEFTKDAVETIEKSLKKYFSEEMKRQVSDVILKNTGLQKMIEQS